MQAGHGKSQSHNKNTGCRSKAKATKRHAPSGRQRGHLGSPLHLARARNSAVTPFPPPPPNTPCRGAQQPRQAVVAERQPYLRPGSRAKKKRKTERPAWRGSLRVVTRGRGSIPQHYNTHSLSTPPQPPPTPPTPSRSNTRFVRGHLLRTVRRGRQTQTRGVARRHARNRTAAQCRRLGRGEGGPGRGVNKGNGEGGGGRRGWMGGETVRRN